MSQKKDNAIFLDPLSAGKCDLLIIAGEHSGDEHAAKIVKDLLKDNPDLSICAIGGENLKKENVQFLFDLVNHSVVGLVEVLKHYSFFKKFFDNVIDWISKYQPKRICFVDYPGLNLALAKKLKQVALSKKGGGSIELVYYISPQIWAWKAKRRFKMAELIDSLAVIFPFEVDCYKDTSLPVEFVGHPFMQDGRESLVAYEKNDTLLLLPGSRKGAVSKIFPVMLETLAILKKNAKVLYPDLPIKNLLESILKKYPHLKNNVELISKDQTPIKAQVALMSSGTMSLNVCLAAIPGAIIYVANPITYILGRMLVKIDYLGISNLLLKRPAWHEFIQGDASPQKIANHLTELFAKDNSLAQQDANTLKHLLSTDSSKTPPHWKIFS